VNAVVARIPPAFIHDGEKMWTIGAIKEGLSRLMRIADLQETVNDFVNGEASEPTKPTHL
jgi:hypothetical protein